MFSRWFNSGQSWFYHKRNVFFQSFHEKHPFRNSFVFLKIVTKFSELALPVLQIPLHFWFQLYVFWRNRLVSFRQERFCEEVRFDLIWKPLVYFYLIWLLSASNILFFQTQPQCSDLRITRQCQFSQLVPLLNLRLVFNVPCVCVCFGSWSALRSLETSWSLWIQLLPSVSTSEPTSPIRSFSALQRPDSSKRLSSMPRRYVML